MRRILAALAAATLVTATAAVPSAVAVPAAGVGTAAATGASAVPSGDVAPRLAPRPPYDPGHGATVSLRSFTSTTGNVTCRRVTSSSGTWLECLLVRTNELLRYGYDGPTVRVPCLAPNSDQTCLLGYGRITISRATAAQRARFATARKVGYERPIQLGAMTVPYPRCIVDPNLGTRCAPAMDDVVNQEIIIGVRGSIWSCPGYEYVDQEPTPKGGNSCLVVRP